MNEVVCREDVIGFIKTSVRLWRNSTYGTGKYFSEVHLTKMAINEPIYSFIGEKSVLKFKLFDCNEVKVTFGERSTRVKFKINNTMTDEEIRFINYILTYFRRDGEIEVKLKKNDNFIEVYHRPTSNEWELFVRHDGSDGKMVIRKTGIYLEAYRI